VPIISPLSKVEFCATVKVANDQAQSKRTKFFFMFIGNTEFSNFLLQTYTKISILSVLPEQKRK
jgi:hypothetical protein